MKRRRLRRRLMIGAVAFAAPLAGGCALAQSISGNSDNYDPLFRRGQICGFGPGMMGMGHRMGPGRMQGMRPWMMRGQGGLIFAEPIQFEALKKQIGITAAQESSWTKYTKEIQEVETVIAAARKSVDDIDKMSQQERFAFISELREQRQEQFERVTAAVNELVAALSDEQKAKAKNILPGLAPFGQGRMRGAFMGSQ